MSQKETREAMKAIDRSGCKTCPAHLTAFCDICFRETVKTFKQGVEHERARLRKEIYMNEIAYKEEPEVALIYKPNMTISEMIDSINGKQPEVDLEEKIQTWCKENVTGVNPIYTADSLTCYLLPKTARHFYELGLNARKKD